VSHDSAGMTGKLQKLVDANIQLLPLIEITTHFVFERHGFVALVERRNDEFGSVGTAGLLSDKGIAPLVWRNGRPFFVARGFDEPASSEQVEQLRAFQADLSAALAA
jgi:hypothetical protein